VNGVVNPSYTYDTNGNMTAGAGRSVTYTAFNMAASIVQGSTTVSLTYDSEHSRVKMTAPSGTTYYLNDPATGAMSEKLVSGSTTTWHDYIASPGDGLVAEKFSGGTAAMRYITLDHLGSVAVVTNESGAVVERNAYDAWGKRRNINGSDDTACSLTSLTTRDYTGHEHIDSECLINANARIYDPTIARFMSADDEVPDAFNGQAFNRFSYVNNGPYSATDPSGHACGDIIISTSASGEGATGQDARFDNKIETVVVTGVCPTSPQPSSQVPTVYYCDESCMRSLMTPPVYTGPDMTASGPGGENKTSNKASTPAPDKVVDTNKGKDNCAYRNASGQCVYTRDKYGKLQFTPEYQDQICRNYHGLQEGAAKANDGWTTFGAAASARGGVPGAIVGLGATVAALITSITTGSGFRPFGATIIPKSDPPPGCSS